MLGVGSDLRAHSHPHHEGRAYVAGVTCDAGCSRDARARFAGEVATDRNETRAGETCRKGIGGDDGDVVWRRVANRGDCFAGDARCNTNGGATADVVRRRIIAWMC